MFRLKEWDFIFLSMRNSMDDEKCLYESWMKNKIMKTNVLFL